MATSSSLRVVDEVELVGEAGAAAAFDGDAQRRLAGLRRRRSRRSAWPRHRSGRLSWRSWRLRPSSLPDLEAASPCVRVSHHRYEAARAASQPAARRMDEPRSTNLGDIGFGYRPRAPYACDPAQSRGRFYRRDRKPDPHAVPARPRPHHPFDRLPPAEAQDAGVHRARGRPLPHPADPYDRGGADRARPGARAALRRGSGRGGGAGARFRPHAVRPYRRGSARTTRWPPGAASTTTRSRCAS